MEVADATLRIYNALAAVVRASRYPPDQVNCPMVFVAPPVETLHETFDGAASQMTVDVVLLVAPVEADKIQRAYAAAEPYRAKTGAKSIYAALEAADGVWVKAADHSAVEYAGVQYVGAVFTVGIED